MNRILQSFYIPKNFRFFVIIFLFLKLSSGLSQVRFNEVLAINATFNYDPKYFNYSSWIELNNTGTTTLIIGGYYLTDSRTNKTKWAIPAGTSIAANTYTIIWCDKLNSGLHTNFSIDPDGETIFLYSSSLVLQDSMQMPKQYPNVSYGRVSNGASLGYFLTPTPSSANGTSEILGMLLPPSFSVPAGRYNTTVNLNISAPYPGVQIRYTIDGSEPTTQSALFSTNLTISQTTVVKAKIFSSYSLPSVTVTQTYFINEHVSSLPVVSVSMNPAFLWDNTIGIYVDGSNGITGNCSDVPKNYNRDWGRYCVMEMFDQTGNIQFNKDFETKIYGACSRHYFPQKSLAFYTRNKYGKGHLEHKLFPSKNIDRFDAFILRNSGNDFNVTMFRDALMQAIIMGKFDLEFQAYQPSVVYLNGSYWGIMNLREKLGEDYIEHNFKVDKDSVDLLEDNAEIVEGSNLDYVNFLKQLGNMDLSSGETFHYINSNIDVDNFIQYFITQIYYGNTDWPGNNIKFWKPRKQGGKWRWLLFDTDFGFSLFPDYSTATHKTLNFVTDSTTTVYWPNPQWSTLLFRKLIKNPYFRDRFIQSFIASVNYVFKPEKINRLTDSISGLISAEMAYHKQKWGGTTADWDTEVQKLKKFALQRYEFIPGHIAQFFKIKEPQAFIGASVSPGNAGYVILNNIQVAGTDTLGLYKNLPYSVTARPADGYKFKRWNIKKAAFSYETLIIKGDTWKYSDKGLNLGKSWTDELYDDSSWPEDTAQLGYGDNDEKTVISYGPNASNKYITSYFRKVFTIADTSNIKKAVINLLCDDGAVIYLNGTEIGRFNMPAGNITYTTLAASAAPEGVYVSLRIDPKKFKAGQNTVAVEIHQNSTQSNDLSFDMDFSIRKTYPDILNETSTEISISDTVKTDIYCVAEFEPVSPVSDIYINEIAARKSRIKDNYGNPDDWFELFNATRDTVDLNGLYISDNFSNPYKFQIRNNGSGNTKIAPLNYAILWADEQEHQGNLHCSFKLSGTGERLGLYQIVGKDVHVVDTITYGLQSDLLSFGRFPDGTAQFIFMDSITPYKSNFYKGIPESMASLEKDDGLQLYPNPVKNTVYINIQETNNLADYIVYDYSGRAVLQGKLTNNQISCNNLRDGVYFITLHWNNKRWSRKFIKI